MSLQLTDDTFEKEIANYDGVALVDFWAPWCGPCQMMGPIIEELSDDLKDDIRIAKLDVDENQRIAQQFSVMSIPTMIVYKNGKEVERVIGVQSKDGLKAKLLAHK